MRERKIYFCQYGFLFSMSKNDAIKLCRDALQGKGHNLMGYSTSRQLKRMINNEVDGLIIGKGYHDINYCLDWDKLDWEILLECLESK